MDHELRAITDEEFEAFSRAEHAAFTEHAPDESVAVIRPVVELDRTLATFDRGRIVGTAAACTVEVTLPGATVVPAAGVTAVGVLPTHRRRGILTAMMDRLLDDVRRRGEPVAVLLASEALIYGRFGYGPAVATAGIEVETRHGAFSRPVAAPGRLTLLGPGEAAGLLPDVFDRARRTQPGEVSRPEVWWRSNLHDPEHRREGYSARFDVVYESPAGVAEGYVTYRAKSDWAAGLAGTELAVQELVATSPEVRLALWRYVLDVDLVRRVTAWDTPLDDPLRWALADPRRLRTTRLGDWLWVRLVDLPAALEARRYPVAGGLVLDVTDPFRPHHGGRVRLDAGPDGAECRPAAAAAVDLALDVADLGAAYLGGVRFSTLARAGRVDERTPGALARADALFACEPLPFCSSEF